MNAKVSEQRNSGANAPLATLAAKLPSRVIDGRLWSPFCAKFEVSAASKAHKSSAPRSPDTVPLRRSRFTITQMFLDLPRCRVAATRYRAGKLSIRVITLSQMGAGRLLPVVSVPAMKGRTDS